MNRYQNGKIYKVIDIDYNKCYIGSTCENLSKRVEGHRKDFKNYLIDKNVNKHYTKSVLLFEEYGMDNAKIELIENFPCNSKEELLQREGYYIEKTNCLNRCVAGRSKIAYNKQRYENTKEQILEQYKDYRRRNKEAIKANKSKIIDCACGSSVANAHFKRHERTKKHIDFMNED